MVLVGLLGHCWTGLIVVLPVLLVWPPTLLLFDRPTLVNCPICRRRISVFRVYQTYPIYINWTDQLSSTTFSPMDSDEVNFQPVWCPYLKSDNSWPQSWLTSDGWKLSLTCSRRYFRTLSVLQNQIMWSVRRSSMIWCLEIPICCLPMSKLVRTSWYAIWLNIFKICSATSPRNTSQKLNVSTSDGWG